MPLNFIFLLTAAAWGSVSVCACGGEMRAALHFFFLPALQLFARLIVGGRKCSYFASTSCVVEERDANAPLLQI